MIIIVRIIHFLAIPCCSDEEKKQWNRLNFCIRSIRLTSVCETPE